MASGVSIEILDLRHFAAPQLRHLLEAESELWNERLHWDYRSSIKLLLQYLDSRMLPGYGALDSGQVAGYAFCVYEQAKAIIGDLFALSTPVGSATHIEETLLRHLLETLLNSPQIDRIESQLLLHPSGYHASVFRENGFHLYRRLFMVHRLQAIGSPTPPQLPAHLELRPWRDDDLTPAARLISTAYASHPDALINDQYCSVYGSQRFLHNIVRYAGCGAFCASCSHVVADRISREIVALVLGSRVSPESGHITQICVHPSLRRRGIARMLLSLAAHHFFRLGAAEISLTVTQANTEAVELYRSEGYLVTHSFDAAVWNREPSA